MKINSFPVLSPVLCALTRLLWVFLRIQPQVILSGGKVCLWENQFSYSRKQPQSCSFKEVKHLEQHLKKQIHVSFVAAQFLIRSCILTEINDFMIQANVWKISFHKQMRKAPGCVFDERFIVTTCRQQQLSTNHLR